MSIFEYDQEKHLRQEREQAWEEGREIGIAEGKAAGIEDKLFELIRKKLEKGKTISQIADELEEKEEVIEGFIRRISDIENPN